MPPRAKKKKAAKRKQQMADAPVGPTPGTLHHPQDNGHHDDLLPRDDAKHGGDGGSRTASSSSGASSPRDDHCSRSEEELLGSGSVAIDGTTEGDKGEIDGTTEGDKGEIDGTTEGDKGETLAQEDDESVVVLEVAFATSGESFAKSDESVPGFTKSEEQDEKYVEQVHVERIVSLPEEGKQVYSAAAEVIEETSVEVQVQVQAAPVSEAQVAVEQLGENREDRCVAAKSETSLAAEVAPPSPPLFVHRSSWWSCCGLVELFTNSGR